jgi:cation diffusion facilitator CzcD-associated flavoprotein CzcO
MTDTSLLIVGAGPYALATAAYAQACGIDTVVVGQPMGFWRDNMPAGMFLRSGSDWHLDVAGVHTLEAFLETRGIAPREVDPLPISLFLDYADWFRASKALDVREDLVTFLDRSDGRFEAVLESGERLTAEAAVAAPGIRHFANLPAWAGYVPAQRRDHTCDLVRFDGLAGARVLIVGGRQSAYEWAALLAEHGAARVDVVHRHDAPRFERVSWRFVDAYVESTLRIPGWWRGLPDSQRTAIAQEIWNAGRLTLEHWLTPRLRGDRIHRHPRTEVVEARPRNGEREIAVRLTDGEQLVVDHVVFASGYRADITRVPYLAGLLDRIDITEGFPRLDLAFATTLPGLHITGFAATRDFGPFFGFVRGCPAAAAIIVENLRLRA